MDDFDFNKPVQVTIFFEGNENSDIIKKEVPDTETDHEVTTASELLKNSNSKTLYPIIPSSFSDNPINTASFSDNATTSKRKLSCTIYETDVQIINKKLSNTNEELQQNGSANQKETLLHKTNETASNCNSVSKNLDKQQCCETAKVAVKDNSNMGSVNEIKKMNNILVNNLLKTVSENLTFIIEAQMDLLKNDYSGTTAQEEMTRKYKVIKSHFFNLSYSTAVNVLLPAENHSAFIDHFLDYTLKLALSKQYTISYDGLRTLYAEMMEWTKRQQNNIQQLLVTPTENQNHPNEKNHALRQLLDARPKQHFTDSNESVFLKKNTDSVIVNSNSFHFKQGPPFNEIRNNVDQTKVNVQPKCNNITVFRNDVQEQTNYKFHQYNVPISYGPPASYNINQQLAPNTYLNAYTNFHKENQMKGPRKPKPGTHQYQAQQKKNVYSHFYNDATGSPPSYYATPNKVVLNNCTPPANYINISLNTNYQSDSRINVLNNEQRTQSETQETPRSLSTDSGFMSPLNFNSPLEEMAPQNADQSDPQTPFITHVTSLNPNVLLMCDSNCCVCGKITNQVCLGCHKYYYCSQICQMIDWSNHQTFCTINGK